MEPTEIPRLGFGDSIAKEFSSALEVAEICHRMFPALADYQAVDDLSFVSRMAATDINGLKVIAFASPPIIARVENPSYAHFHFFLSGSAKFDVDGYQITAQAKSTAVYIPEKYSFTEAADRRSVIAVRVDQQRLAATARIMLGPKAKRESLEVLDRPAALPLQFAEFNFDAVFRNVFEQIDCFSQDEAMLRYSSFDDVFYRTLALALAPEVFAREFTSKLTSTSDRQLDRVCQQIRSRLSDRITLTDLEHFGNMSQRTLHNAFVKRYGMSPMEWVREQRLLEAHMRLKQSHSNISIGEVVYDCGFTNHSVFTSQYARRFGELPSETLAESVKHARPP